MLPDHHASCKGVPIIIYCHYLVARQMQVAPLPGPGADNSLGLRDPRCSDRGMSAFRRVTLTIIALMSLMVSIPRRELVVPVAGALARWCRNQGTGSSSDSVTTASGEMVASRYKVLSSTSCSFDFD